MDQHLVSVWNYARSRGLPLLVLAVLAHHADEQGVSTASNDEIVAETGLGPTSVKASMRQLEIAGDISYVSPGGLKRGDRRCVLLGNHIRSASHPIQTHKIESTDRIIMSMRKESPRDPLFSTRQHRLRCLRLLGMVA